MRSSPEPTGLVVSEGLVAEVFWRPGCPYCSALRRDLARRGVRSRWRNIWDDEEAWRFVRGANAGNETVPTVRVGSRTLTNPSGRQVAALVGGGDEPAGRPRGVSRGARWIVSWLPMAALVGLSEVLAGAGHGDVSWGADAAAVAAWWLTRPLRR